MPRALSQILPPAGLRGAAGGSVNRLSMSDGAGAAAAGVSDLAGVHRLLTVCVTARLPRSLNILWKKGLAAGAAAGTGTGTAGGTSLACAKACVTPATSGEAADAVVPARKAGANMTERVTSKRPGSGAENSLT